MQKQNKTTLKYVHNKKKKKRSSSVVCFCNQISDSPTYKNPRGVVTSYSRSETFLSLRDLWFNPSPPHKVKSDSPPKAASNSYNSYSDEMIFVSIEEPTFITDVSRYRIMFNEIGEPKNQLECSLSIP